MNKYCHQCGAATVILGAKFCSNCGSSLQGGTETGFPLHASNLDPDTSIIVKASIVPPILESTFADNRDIASVLPPLRSNIIATKIAPASKKKLTVKTGTTTTYVPGICLVKKGDPHQLVFRHAHDLKRGQISTLELAGFHSGQSVGRQYIEEKKHDIWRYTESALGAGAGISVKYIDGSFIVLQDADLVFDVAFWQMREGVAVNFVGGPSNGHTMKHGRGRDFNINSDGTISPKSHSNLVLGAQVEITAHDIKGCWACGFFPFGSACFRTTAIDKNTYREIGLFFVFFFFPLPYYKTRRKKGTSSSTVFTNENDSSDLAGFLNAKKLDFGPSHPIGCGGKIC